MKVPLFKNLSQHSLVTISASSTVSMFEDGQIIMLENDQVAPVYFILEGNVRAYRTNMDGREQTLTILKMGDGFNLPAAFSSDHLSPASAASFGNSKVILINQANFRGLVKELPDFSLAILNDLSDKLIHLTNLVHEVSLMSVRGRLAKFLLVEFEKKGTPPTRWTQEQIAARLGTRREVLSRSLRELVEDGLVRTERQKIIIIDAERLKEEAGI